ncbi:MAG: twin-arginine translocase subunit TatC [Phycisphaerales bacterium]|nr:twin-arginine translocase subunit TatC [Phycisphaerales bacterium]
MTFGDHLEELRRRVILGVAVPLPLAFVLFLFAEPIRTAMCAPLFEALRTNDLPVQLQALSPIETLLLDMKLSLIFAVVLSAPWILWQAWMFVRPGLYSHERRFVYLLLPGSGVLTLAGIALLYWVILPLVLAMLVSMSTSGEQIVLGGATEVADARPPATLPLATAHPAVPVPGQVWIKMPEHVLCVAVPETADPDAAVHVLTVPLARGTVVVQQYRLSEYIGFVLMLMTGVAIAFQLPLVILLLGWLDIVRIETLRKQRKYAFFGCAVAAAIVTPPDVLSMLLMWLPLAMLYELGIVLLRLLPAWRVAGLAPPAEPSASGTASARDSAPPPPVASRSSVPRGAAAPETDEGSGRKEPPDAGDEGETP